MLSSPCTCPYSFHYRPLSFLVGKFINQPQEKYTRCCSYNNGGDGGRRGPIGDGASDGDVNQEDLDVRQAPKGPIKEIVLDGAIFMNLMNYPLLFWIIIVVFINDMLAYSTKKDHAEHLRMALETLRREKLYRMLNKCGFWLYSVSFLYISSQEMKFLRTLERFLQRRIDPYKKSVSEIWFLLGLVRYYRRFVQDFSEIVEFLTKLLKKNERNVNDLRIVLQFLRS